MDRPRRSVRAAAVAASVAVSGSAQGSGQGSPLASGASTPAATSTYMSGYAGGPMGGYASPSPAGSAMQGASAYATPGPSYDSRVRLQQQQQQMLLQAQMQHWSASPAGSHLRGGQPRRMPFPGGPPQIPPSQQPFPLSKSNFPLPPNVAVGQGQARHTTFASRMKLGTTTLMRPLPKEEGADAAGRGVDDGGGRGTRVGRRGQRITTYVDEGSDVEDDDDSDDDAAATGANGTPQMGKQGAAAKEEEDTNAEYLGLPPPANKVIVKRARKCQHLYYPEYELTNHAESLEQLVPIRIEFDTDTHRIRDIISWNLNERLLSPIHFARCFLSDLDLPLEPYAAIIESSIQAQIDEYAGLFAVEVGPAAGGDWAAKSEAAWKEEKGKDVDEEWRATELVKHGRTWEFGLDQGWDEYCKTNGGKDEKPRAVPAADDEDGETQGPDSLALDPRLGSGDWEDDIRVYVEVDTQVLSHHVRDRLEWDICSPLTPEAFSAALCRDLSMTGEAVPLISNVVREQLMNGRRAAIEHNLVGMGTVWGEAYGNVHQGKRRIEARLRMEREVRKRRRLGVDGAETMTANVTASPSPAPGQTTTGGAAAEVDAASAASGSRARSPSPDMTPEQQIATGRAVLLEMHQSKAPKALEGVWRDFVDAKTAGPFVEMRSGEEYDRVEEGRERASRRSRRGLQSQVGSLRHRGR